MRRDTSKKGQKTKMIKWVFLYRKNLISDFESPFVLMKRQVVRKNKCPLPLAVNRVEQIPCSFKTRKQGPPCWLALGGSYLPQTSEVSLRKGYRDENRRHMEEEEEVELKYSSWFCCIVVLWCHQIPEHKMAGLCISKRGW